MYVLLNSYVFVKTWNAYSANKPTIITKDTLSCLSFFNCIYQVELFISLIRQDY